MKTGFKDLSYIPKGYIFHDSILKNITMFNNNVNITRLYKITKDLGLHSFVNSLPRKYDTIIGGKEIQFLVDNNKK